MKHYTIELKKRRPDMGWTSPEKARQHLQFLRDGGMRFTRIAALTGLTADGISRICNGRTTSIQRHNEKAILGVRLSGQATADPVAMVPLFTTSRRLQALVRMGFTQTYLAERLGICLDTIGHYVKVRGYLVRSEVAARVEELFNELQMTPLDSPILQTGHAKKARTIAIKRGWSPPLAWDEDAIDNHAATPEEPERRAVTFPEKYAELRDQVGLSDEWIAPRLGLQYCSLKRQLERYGIPVGDSLQVLVHRERTEREAA